MGEHKVLVTAIAGLLGGLILAGGVAAAILSPAEEWNPLGDYPDQVVIDITDAAVIVEGTKCNDLDTPIRVQGTWSWQRVDPSGTGVLIGAGTDIRQPGCTTARFENDILPAVRAADRPGAVWRLTGTEFPINEDGTLGVPRTWETENFVLTPIP